MERKANAGTPEQYATPFPCCAQVQLIPPPRYAMPRSLLTSPLCSLFLQNACSATFSYAVRTLPCCQSLAEEHNSSNGFPAASGEP